MNYYNENDPKIAAWLRELIKADIVAPGEVDERSIEDVTPNDLRGFRQHHFFAGIGVWSYALRLAGWPDDREVWTGSCPCQPFSAAGKGEGFADERHLWPAWFWLIQQCRPVTIFGEQVASRGGKTWFDLVSNDLEGIAYTTGAIAAPACGFGAPHQRQRIYFMAYDSVSTKGTFNGKSRQGGRQEKQDRGRSSSCKLANDTNFIGRGLLEQRESDSKVSKQGKKQRFDRCGTFGKLADTESARRRIRDTKNKRKADAQSNTFANSGDSANDRPRQNANGLRRPGPTNGFWRDADWLRCRDGKWRPARPGTFPLVDGTPARVLRLRGYGNAIVAEQAKEFIKVAMEVL